VNILFLEHDRDSRRMVKDMMRTSGATVIEMGDLADLIAFGDEDAALALIEMGPDTDGLAAITLLATRTSGRPPIIALAAEPGLIAPAQAAGADEVLTAPVAMTTLFQAIGRYLPADDPD
jgi:CheY-like chemotaxis protein